MKKNPYLTFPREFTTGKWRVHLVYPGEPRADGFPRGSKKGNPPCADTMVEFYDTEDNGQFVASFHMNTLLGYPWNGMVGADLDGLEAYGFAYPLSTQAATDWLEGDDLAKVNAFLKETCKEAFGILARCGRWRLFPFGGSERSRPIALRSPGEQESRPQCDSETE